jgi:hypothetical protein
LERYLQYYSLVADSFDIDYFAFLENIVVVAVVVAVPKLDNNIDIAIEIIYI